MWLNAARRIRAVPLTHRTRHFFHYQQKFSEWNFALFFLCRFCLSRRFLFFLSPFSFKKAETFRYKLMRGTRTWMSRRRTLSSQVQHHILGGANSHQVEVEGGKTLIKFARSRNWKFFVYTQNTFFKKKTGKALDELNQLNLKIKLKKLSKKFTRVQAIF